MKKIIKIVLLLIFLPLAIVYYLIDVLLNEENINNVVEKFIKWLDK